MRLYNENLKELKQLNLKYNMHLLIPSRELKYTSEFKVAT
jgi:hypothetical protein